MTRRRISDPNAFLSSAKSPEAFAMDVAELRRVLDYNRESGEFRWLKKLSNRALAGSVAGTLEGYGYIQILIHGTLVKAHRLAWVFAYGQWPSGLIDHVNGNRADNSLLNLRDASRLVNQQNLRSAPKNSSTGILGAHIATSGKPFRSRIRVDGKERHIGKYETAEQAHAAYVAAKRRLHEGCTL